MPKLTGKKKELFIAELIAHSVISNFDLDGNLSANFHLRHKIRDADIASLYNRCAATPAGSFERVLCVGHLLAFSCAAYDTASVDNMIGSDSLAAVKVTPFYDTVAFLLKEGVCDEPLNLWYGLGKENMQSNTRILDSHKIDVGNDGNNRKIQVASVTNDAPALKRPKRTDGDIYFSSHSGGASASLRGRPPNIPILTSPGVSHGTAAASSSSGMSAQSPPAALKRVSTPVSGYFDDHLKEIFFFFDPAEAGKICTTYLCGSKNLIDKILDFHSKKNPDVSQLNPMIESYRQDLCGQFEKIVKLVAETSVAGSEHYSTLIQQAAHRGYDLNTKEAQLLETAKNAWGTNRQYLLKILGQKYDLLLAASGKTDIQQGVRGGLHIPDGHFLILTSAQRQRSAGSRSRQFK